MFIISQSPKRLENRTIPCSLVLKAFRPAFQLRQTVFLDFRFKGIAELG
jgi:hypothetical protein